LSSNRLTETFIFLWTNNPTRTSTVPLLRFLNHTHTHTHTSSRTPPNEWSARRSSRHLHNTKHTHKRRTFMPTARFFIAFSCYLYFIRACLSWLSCIFPVCLYLQHTTETSMPLAEFEPAIPAGERPQTYALDRSATGIGWIQTRDPSVQVASDTRFRPQGYLHRWDVESRNLYEQQQSWINLCA
jgi:hypothetical protein